MVANLIEDRKYQNDAIQSSLEKYNTDPLGVGILYLCTGAGKTIISSKLVQIFLDDLNKKKVLFIVHREELAKQTLKKMLLVMGKGSMFDIGVVKAHQNELGRKITIASIQTLLSQKRLDAVLASGPYDLIVVDEVHHYLNDNLWFNVTQQVRKNGFTIGLTATPNDIKEEYLNDIIYRYSIFQGIKDKVLVDIEGIKRVIDLDLSSVKIEDGDYNEKSLSKLMRDPKVLDYCLKIYKELAVSKKTVAFCVNVDHATTFCDLLQENGINAKCITGETPSNERDRIYNDFENGNINCLVSVNVLTEGWDCTALDCLLLLRPTMSETLYIQMVGRALRKHPGKKKARVIDVVGNSDKHKLMQLGILFGKQPKLTKELPADKLADLDKEQTASGNIPSVLELIAKEENFELHDDNNERIYDWIKFDEGFILSLGSPKYGFLVVKKVPDQFNMYSVFRYYSKNIFDRVDILVQEIPLDWAISLSEKEINGILGSRSGFINKDAPWKNTKISDKQKEILIKLEVKNIPETKGEASKIIEERMLINSIKAYETKAFESEEGMVLVKQMKQLVSSKELLINNNSPFDPNMISLSEAKRIMAFHNNAKKNKGYF